MIKYKETIREVVDKKILSVQCDRCKVDYTDDFEIQEFLYVRFTGGYGSIFGDCCRVECDICQHCLKKYTEKHCRIEDVMI